MSKKINKNETTKKYITAALFKLMNSMEFNEISVTMITDKAGVGRVSYYRNFSSKEDIIIKYFQSSVSSFMEEAPEINKQKDYLPLIEFVFKKFYENREIFRLIDKAKLGYIYLDFLNSGFAFNFQKNFADSPKLHAALYSGSLYNLSMSWIEDGFLESPKDLASLYYDFCFGKK
jgi:AcrR family transcriptional regulator